MIEKDVIAKEVIANELWRPWMAGFLLAGMLCTSCSRAPSFDILGSFFPAWLLCFALGLLLTVAARWVLLRMGVALVLPTLTYPSLVAVFTFGLWLGLFR
jgi:YtcA family